jgi:hypothetical protein
LSIGGYLHVIAAGAGLSVVFHAVPPLCTAVRLAGARCSRSAVASSWRWACGWPCTRIEAPMYTSTFIFAKKQFEDELHRLDQAIAAAAKAGQAKWLDGYRIVIAEVQREYGVQGLGLMSTP